MKSEQKQVRLEFIQMGQSKWPVRIFSSAPPAPPHAGQPRLFLLQSPPIFLISKNNKKKLRFYLQLHNNLKNEI